MGCGQAPKESGNDKILRTNLVEVGITINERNNELNETNKKIQENYQHKIILKENILENVDEEKRIKEE